MKTTFAYAALNTSLKPPAISVWTVRGTASLVRHAVGWAWFADDPKEGWKAARIEGMRVVKVKINPIPARDK